MKMKKWAIFVALLLCSPTTIITKIMLPHTEFINYVGKDVPQFGHIKDHKATIFSTPFLYSVDNYESFYPFLPEPIKAILEENPHIPAHYWIRISSSVKPEPNIHQEFEDITMPWSILYHGCAFKKAILSHKQRVAWGIFEPILMIKKKPPRHNLMGYAKRKNSLLKNQFHIEELNIPNPHKKTNDTYNTVLPLDTKRNVMNFWSCGIIKNVNAHNKWNNHIIIIFECIFKEPLIKNRINKTTAGVFNTDLNLSEADESDLERICSRLNDYHMYLKDKNYEPFEPFNENLKQAFHDIIKTEAHKDDILALENFVNTIKVFRSMEKTSPLTLYSIEKLAESYSDEFQLGKTKKSILNSIKSAAPMATEEQVLKIFNKAKKIHKKNVNFAYTFATKLREKSKQTTVSDHLFKSLPLLYRPYAKSIYLQTTNNADEILAEMYKLQENHEKKLQDALNKLARCSHYTDNYTAFLKECNKQEFDDDIKKDEIFHIRVFQHTKQFVEHELENIYNTIDFAFNGKLDPSKKNALKTLRKQTLALHEKILSLHSLDNEDTLLHLADTQLPNIKKHLKELFIPTQTNKKKKSYNDSIFESKIKKLLSLGETESQYKNFIAEVKNLEFTPDNKACNQYQEAYITACKKVLEKELNRVKEIDHKNDDSLEKSLNEFSKKLASASFENIDRMYKKLRNIAKKVN